MYFLASTILYWPKNTIIAPSVIARFYAGLFSTKSLVNAHPDHPIEVRTQLKQPADQNIDENSGENVWAYYSHRTHSTIAKYAAYQAQSFTDYIIRVCFTEYFTISLKEPLYFFVIVLEFGWISNSISSVKY